MSTKSQKTIVFISMGVLGFLLFGLWMTLGEPTAAPKRKPEKRDAERWTTAPPGLQSQNPSPDTLTDFQSSGFYRMIIDNNIFRPLGWRPPRKREPYRLLGTLLPTTANTPKQAILQVNTSKQTHIVKIGDKLDADTTVIDIHPKAVQLEKDGHPRTLKLNTAPWIK